MKIALTFTGKSILLASIVLLVFGRPLPGQVIDFITKSASSLEQATGPAAMNFDPNEGSPIRFEKYLHDQFEGWSIGYRTRQLHSSYTTYEFGMPTTEPVVWSPISRLEFPLDSTWHGMQIERRTPKTDLHFEWLTPIGNGINGTMNDYDWIIPGEDFTDLGLTKARWNDGQSLDLALQYQLFDNIISAPVEFWLTGGFRWQRFDLTDYSLSQVKYENVWQSPPLTMAGDASTFNQQYYTEYLGGEFRTTLTWVPSLPLELRAFGDYGGAQGYNVDHHLLRAGDRYTMESTSGDSWRYGLSAELYLGPTYSIGAQYDHLFIRTWGQHRWYNEPYGINETWSNGVHVWSAQSSLSVFFRIRV